MLFSSAFYLLFGLKLFLFLPWLIYFFSIIIFLKQKFYFDFFANYRVIFIIFIALFIIFLVLAQRDFLFNLNHVSLYVDYLKPVPNNFYIYHADNLMPWKISRILLNRLPLSSPGAKDLLGGVNFFDRTPGLPMITAVVLNFFGEGHFIYQRWMEVLAAVYAGALFVFLSSYFRERVAILAMILCFLNVPFFWMAFSAEYFSKYFSVYFIFLALIFYFLKKKKKNQFFPVIIFLFLGFLFHPSSLIYAIVFLGLIFSQEGINLESLKRFCILFLIILILIGTWYFLPLVTGEIDGFSRTHSIFFYDFSSFSENIIKAKLINVTGLFVPNMLLRNPEGSGYISLSSKIFRYEFFRYSLISNLTPLFFILIIYFLLKNMRKDRTIIVLGIGPFIVYWLLYLNQYNYYFHYGGGYFHLFIFAVPVLIAYAVQEISRFKTLIGKILIFFSYCIFMLYNLYFLSGIFPAIKFINPIVSLFSEIILGLFLVICFFLLKYVVNYKSF